MRGSCWASIPESAEECVGSALAALDGPISELGEDGRVLLRYSGTEPVLRVMVEGPDRARIQEMAQDIADLVSAELGA